MSQLFAVFWQKATNQLVTGRDKITKLPYLVRNKKGTCVSNIKYLFVLGYPIKSGYAVVMCRVFVLSEFDNQFNVQLDRV